MKRGFNQLGPAPVLPERELASVLECLEGEGWLTDEVVNAFFRRLTERMPTVYAFSSHFLPALTRHPTGYDYEAVGGWLKQTAIFTRAVLFLPFFHSSRRHWTLIMVDMRSKTIAHLDPLWHPLREGETMRLLRLILRFLQDEWVIKYPGIPPLDPGAWHLAPMVAVPRQPDGGSCGVYCCVFSARLARAACSGQLDDGLPSILKSLQDRRVVELREYVRDVILTGLNLHVIP